ncbi:unnamed protein product, partial [Effrenium voratum]
MAAMEETKVQFVTVAVQTLGASVDQAVLVTLALSAALVELKQALADMFERPEILTDGRFLKQMPNGATVNMHDNQKLGSRREVIYDGPPLTLASEAQPLTSLDDFDGLDETVEVQSPRSLRAMELQGVSQEELYYAPAECFWEPGLDSMIGKLHHDFFEAWRQDTLLMCRAQRSRILEDVEEEAELDQSTRDWMASVNSSKPHEDSSAELSVEKAPMPRFFNTESCPDERIYGTGGSWSGALEPHQYPLTMRFFEDLKQWMQFDKVCERALPSRHKSVHDLKQGKPAQKGISIPKRLDLDSPGVKVKDASQEVKRLVGELQRIPREAKRPQASALARQTLSVAVVQRSKNARARDEAMSDVVDNAECMVSVADAQRKIADANITEVGTWRDHREACSQESRGDWQNNAQETNFTNAYRRCDYWHQRREAVHQRAMEDEESRYDATVKLAERDVVVAKRVGRLRDLARIKIARQWLERRIRWAKRETALAKQADARKAVTTQRYDDAQARVRERNIRLAKLIEFKKEYNALRKLLCRMAAEREERRRDSRRQEVASRLTAWADKVEAAQKSREAQTGKELGWRATRPLHLLSSSELSQASKSLASTKDVEKSAKRMPRFDFGRFG